MQWLCVWCLWCCTILSPFLCHGATPRRDCHGVVHHHGASIITREAHHRDTEAYLEPVEHAALELYNVSRKLRKDGRPSTAVLQLAHALLRVHDEFEDTCRDHHWGEALSHSFCGMLLQVDVTHGPVDTAVCGARSESSVADCMCRGMDALLRSCQSGVLPWSRDGAYCASGGWCAEHDPFRSFCHAEQNRRHRSHGRAQSHQEHHRKGTRGKEKIRHSTWSARSKETEQSRWLSEAHRRLAHDRVGGGPITEEHHRRHYPAKQTTKATNKNLHTAATPAATHHAPLAHHTQPEFVLLLRYSTGLTATKLRAQKRCSICVPRDRPELAAITTGMFTTCTVHRTATLDLAVEALYSSTCDAIAAWRAEGELAHLHPCRFSHVVATHDKYCMGKHRATYRHTVFQDPAKAIVRVRQAAAAARRESTTSESTACAHAHKDAHHHHTNHRHLRLHHGHHHLEDSLYLTKACRVWPTAHHHQN